MTVRRRHPKYAAEAAAAVLRVELFRSVDGQHWPTEREAFAHNRFILVWNAILACDIDWREPSVEALARQLAERYDLIPRTK